MGDPVTMAVVGASAGAMMNKKDPLKGALLGAAGGYGGATLMGGMGAAGAGGSGILPSALSGSTTTAANQALVTGSLPSSAAGIGFQTAAPTAVEAAKTGLFSGAMPATNAAMQGQGLAQTTAMQRPLSLGMPGVEPGQGYEYTLGDRLGQVGQFAQQNPVLTQMAMQTGQGLLQQQHQQPPPAGIMRGSSSQAQMPQYQIGVPKVSLI